MYLSIFFNHQSPIPSTHHHSSPSHIIVLHFVDYSGEINQIRRYFHTNPELKYEENNTATNLASYLEELGIETTTKVAETGVVGLLRGEHEGPCIMLRAGKYSDDPSNHCLLTNDLDHVTLSNNHYVM